MLENIQEIILKVTRDCNLRCQYCYIPNKDRYCGERMSFQTFKNLIAQILKDRGHNKIQASQTPLNIVFHGGEPTLLGLKKTQQFINYARSQIPNITFSMQTNLTLLNEKWARLFKNNKISPGVSLDGIQSKENELRKYGYNFLDKICLLKKRKVNFGILMVLTRNNIANYAKNLREFKSFFGKGFKANFVEDINNPEHSPLEVTPEELYSRVFLPTVQQLLQEKTLDEHNINQLLRRFFTNWFFYKKPAKEIAYTNCLTRFCGGGNNIVEIEPDGTVLFCGRWAGSNPLNTLGNINNPADFFGLFSFQQVLKLQIQKINDIRLKSCDSCKAKDICTYGCLAFAYEKYQGKIKIRKDLICNYYQKIITYLQKNKYALLWAYAQAQKWLIIPEKNYYLIEPKPNSGNWFYKINPDQKLTWFEVKGNKYLKFPKHLLAAKK